MKANKYRCRYYSHQVKRKMIEEMNALGHFFFEEIKMACGNKAMVYSLLKKWVSGTDKRQFERFVRVEKTDCLNNILVGLGYLVLQISI
jgi:hypothetical protein